MDDLDHSDGRRAPHLDKLPNIDPLSAIPWRKQPGMDPTVFLIVALVGSAVFAVVGTLAGWW